jgi:D-citramalate synthase
VKSVKFIDGTLREGEQTPGVHFTMDEKIQIARSLDDAGVDILDVGMPGVSEGERKAIRAIANLGLKASVGVSVRMRKQEIDQAADCGAEEIFIICSVSSIHMESKLNMAPQDVKTLAGEMTAYGVSKGLVVNLVAEDAARADISFMTDVICLSHSKGAKRVFLCDTLGVLDPFKIKTMVEDVRAGIPTEMGIGVHCHDDLGMATANTLAAVGAGADFPAVTVNGIGERAGNAPLHEVGLSIEKILQRTSGLDHSRLYELSRLVEKCSGIFIPPHAPIVGLNAFRHESGIHVDGLLKDSRTYTGLAPEEVNRSSTIVLGKHSGIRSIEHLLQQKGIEADPALMMRILERVKIYKEVDEKKENQRMFEEIEQFYARTLSFPEDVFWDIVNRVTNEHE